MYQRRSGVFIYPVSINTKGYVRLCLCQVRYCFYLLYNDGWEQKKQSYKEKERERKTFCLQLYMLFKLRILKKGWTITYEKYLLLLDMYFLVKEITNLISNFTWQR
jgi:hypothetical protein